MWKYNGYTLVEVLVVISVMAMLSSILILYNRTGEKQIILFKEQAKVINAILRAKSFAVQTYTKESSPCAYGVHFDASGEYRIFQDLDANRTAENCGAANNKYEPGEDLEPPAAEKLDRNLQLSEMPTDIVFIPPDPKTIINGDANVKNALIKISTPDNASSVSIKVNNFGQISAE